jgi:hypothetical protein
MKEYPYHPLANAYPLMEGAEFEAFCLNLSQEGLKLPIHLWRGQVIDGRNRQRACRLQHVDPVYQDDTDLVPEGRLEAHIASLNEHRRHLGEDFLRKRREERVARVAEKRREGKSQRQIAEEEGVSRAQVNRDLEEVQLDRGGPVEPEGGKVTGKDKRKRTAKPRKAEAADAPVKGLTVGPPETNGTPPPGSTEPPGSVEPDPPPPDHAPLKDPFGLTVPEKLRPVFGPDPEAKRQEALSLLRKLSGLVNEYASSPAGDYLRHELRREGKGDEDVRYRDTGLTDLARRLKQLAPYCSVCPYCHAKNRSMPSCNCCAGRGWVPASVFERTAALPPDYLEALHALKEEAP